MNGSHVLRVVLIASLLPSVLLAQPVVYNGKFVQHSFASSTDGGAKGTVYESTYSLPFAQDDTAGQYSGKVEITYPATLPPATLDAEGKYLLFGDQSVTLRYKFSVTWSWAGGAEDMHIGYVDLEIGPMTGDRPLPLCRKETPQVSIKGPGSRTWEESIECTWNKFPNGMLPGSNPQSFMLANAHLTASGPGFIGGVGWQVYTTYSYPPPVDLTVDRIEMVQVVQKQDNSIPMIAEKATVARVFVGLGETATSPQPNVSVLLRGTRAGGTLPGTPLSPFNGTLSVPVVSSRDNKDHSFNFLLPDEWTKEGTIVLEAYVNPNATVPELNLQNNTKSIQVPFLASHAFLVNYLRVCFRWTDAFGVNDACPSDFVTQAQQKLERLYPLRNGDVIYAPLKAPTWYWTRPFLNDWDMEALRVALRKRWELTESVEGVRADQLTAWLPYLKMRFPNLWLGLSDPVWAGQAGRIGFQQDTSLLDTPGTAPVESNAANLMAHEIGHNLGLRHPNTADANGANDPQTDWPHGDAKIQQPGFDPIAKRFVPKSSWELMAYREKAGRNAWISPFSYEKLINGGFKPRAAGGSGAAASPYLLVSGSARADGSGGSLDPVIPLHSSTAADPSNPSGDHCIRLSGAAGTLLDYCFALVFQSHLGTALEEQYFVHRIPVQSGTTRVSLRRGESELAAIAASTSAPTVSITSPAAGATLQGKATVRWTGSDPDGDTLTYAVLYSPDSGSSWIPLETDIRETEASVQTAETAAGTQILFRVIATDGINSATATAGPVTVVAQPVIDAATSLDFGTTTIGTAVTLALHVANRGEKALSIQAVTTSNAEFSVTASMPATVAPRGNADLEVRFLPAGAGVRSGTLTILSDDPEHAGVAVSVLGGATALPQISVTPAALDFDPVAIGSAAQLTATVSNNGSGPLTLAQLAGSDSQFRVTSPGILPVQIAAGATAPLTVEFRPVQAGLQFGEIGIASDSVSQPLFPLPLSGSGTGTASACAYNWGVPSSDTLAAGGGTGSNSFITGDGCAWTVASSAPWLTFASAVSGSGTAVVQFEARPNSGPERRAIVSVGGATFGVRQLGMATTYAAIPAVASTRGNYSSYFRTSLQLHNPFGTPISGSLAFHPMGVEGTSSDPAISWAIPAGATLSIPDIVPVMSASGAGTLDVTSRVGGLPVAMARIFNDGGEGGTSGLAGEAIPAGNALAKGERAVLIGPPEPSRARYNIGLRTFDHGTQLRVTVRDRNGIVRTAFTRGYPATYMIQQGSADFLGLTLLANDSITFEVLGGSAVIYGAANDNTTQDPTQQIARPVPDPGSSGGRRIVPVVGSARGLFQSNFRTAFQIHNASSATITGRMVFHPAGREASAADPVIPYELQAGATAYYEDLLGPLGITGIGSLDLTSTTGPLPAAMVRIFNDAGTNGTSGVGEDAMTEEEALRAGETGVILAPPDPSTARINIGIRTLGSGASLTITRRSASGTVVRTITRSYGADFFQQFSAASMFDGDPGPSDSLSFHVDSGSAIVYGASNDNVTNDPSLQVATRR